VSSVVVGDEEEEEGYEDDEEEEDDDNDDDDDGSPSGEIFRKVLQFCLEARDDEFPFRGRSCLWGGVPWSQTKSGGMEIWQ